MTKPVLKPVLEPFCLCRLSGRNGGQFSLVRNEPWTTEIDRENELEKLQAYGFFTQKEGGVEAPDSVA